MKSLKKLNSSFIKETELGTYFGNEEREERDSPRLLKESWRKPKPYVLDQKTKPLVREAC